jgi:hypothetical protein
VIRLIPLPLLLAGCIGEFATVDEACKDGVDGAKHAPAEIGEAVQRFVCHRRVAGIGGGRIDKHVQEAATAHADYLVENGIPMDWASEDPSLPGFTGRDDWERLAAAGQDDVSYESTGIWVLLISEEVDFYPAETMPERIDLWMGDPYLRQIVLQPSMEAVGLAHVEDLWYGTVVYALPPDQHGGSPLVYPSDGQTEVPTSWTPVGIANDGLAPGVPIGFPITVTVSGDEEDWYGAANEFNLQVASPILEGPDGEVPARFIGAGTVEPTPFPYTATLVPDAPLAPDTEYTFTATVTWGEDLDKDVEVTFRTASE